MPFKNNSILNKRLIKEFKIKFVIQNGLYLRVILSVITIINYKLLYKGL